MMLTVRRTRRGRAVGATARSLDRSIDDDDDDGR
jgi:hypothetical protein